MDTFNFIFDLYHFFVCPIIQFSLTFEITAIVQQNDIKRGGELGDPLFLYTFFDLPIFQKKMHYFDKADEDINNNS